MGGHRGGADSRDGGTRLSAGLVLWFSKDKQKSGLRLMWMSEVGLVGRTSIAASHNEA
jgi:hypothetical protein